MSDEVDRVLLELVVDNSGHVQQSLRWDLRKYVNLSPKETDRHVLGAKKSQIEVHQ